MTVARELTLGPARERVAEFERLGVEAFTTTRHAGTFSFSSDEPARAVMGRWDELQRLLRPTAARLATAHQVHGSHVLVHEPRWEGWLRAGEGDGHASFDRGTAMAVSIADCVPVFVAHPSGASALLHSGWRGTVARILDRGLDLFDRRALRLSDVAVHLGPAICGGCYEVSPDVFAQLTGRTADRPTTVDLRAIIASHARARGVRHVTVSAACTRCDGDRFFSHRAGDQGRQVAVIIAGN